MAKNSENNRLVPAGWEDPDRRLTDHIAELRRTSAIGEVSPEELSATLIELAVQGGALGRLDEADATFYVWDLIDELKIEGNLEGRAQKQRAAKEHVNNLNGVIVQQGIELAEIRDAAEMMPNPADAIEKLVLQPAFRDDLIHVLELALQAFENQPGPLAPADKIAGMITILRKTATQRVVEIPE